MKILVTGSNGLLGQKIVRQLIKRKINFVATSSGQNRNPNCPADNYCTLDITNLTEIKEVVSLCLPTVIINTAAMTNVDACEENPLDCSKVNVNAVKNLFQVCKSSGIQFVHLSTDFVFDGESGPYKESDAINPLSVYARSKAKSEKILQDDIYTNWSILRTIIVFGKGDNLSRTNIVLWAKEALASKQKLSIVDDQFRAPTWADDLAWACIEAAVQNATGVFHISGPETFSIFELVKRVADFHGHSTENITKVSSATLNQKAKRPPKTGFDIQKARKELGYAPMSFEESLGKLEN